MVSSGWLLFGEVICAKTKGAEAAPKHLVNANQKSVLHLCKSSPNRCEFVDDTDVAVAATATAVTVLLIKHLRSRKNQNVVVAQLHRD